MLFLPLYPKIVWGVTIFEGEWPSMFHIFGCVSYLRFCNGHEYLPLDHCH